MTPPYERHTGHVLDVLRTLPDQHVQCIATSPPYFGLRDYGLEPVIWEPVVYAPMPGLPGLPVPAHAAPDAFATCDHDWGEWVDAHDVREDAVHGKTHTTDRFYGDESRRFDGNHQKHAHGQFCRKCGAWRGCLGLEPDPNLYIGHLVAVFREARRVLADDGVCWLNLGDCYASGKIDHLAGKDLVGIPWRAALALQADGWILRRDVVWAKGASFVDGWSGNPMPESVTDRPTAAHEFIFLLAKRERYFYDHAAVRETARATATGAAASFKRAKSKRAQSIPGQAAGTHRDDRPDVAYNQAQRNLRDVWGVCAQPFPGAHFAVFPPDLVRPMILAGSREGDAVLDLFAGSGTSAQVALDLRRRAVLIDANPDYAPMQEDRIAAGRLGLPYSPPKAARQRGAPASRVNQPGLFTAKAA